MMTRLGLSRDMAVEHDDGKESLDGDVVKSRVAHALYLLLEIWFCNGRHIHECDLVRDNKVG